MLVETWHYTAEVYLQIKLTHVSMQKLLLTKSSTLLSPPSGATYVYLCQSLYIVVDVGHTNILMFPDFSFHHVQIIGHLYYKYRAPVTLTLYRRWLRPEQSKVSNYYR